MKKLLIIKNSAEGPGLLEEILKEQNWNYEIIDLNQGQTFPDPQSYSAIVVLGGPDSANDQTEKMENELKQIQKVLVHNIPYLGICLGLQTLVKTAGGKVVKNAVKETGLRDPQGNQFEIELTESGIRDPLFEGLPSTLKVFQLHGETVELTENMQLLGVGKFCRNQAVKIGAKAYGLQCHFELTPQMFEQWVKDDHDLQKLDVQQLHTDFKILEKTYIQTGQKLFENFLKIAQNESIKV